VKDLAARLGEHRGLVMLTGFILLLFAGFWIHVTRSFADHALAAALVIAAVGAVGFAYRLGTYTPAIYAFVGVPLLLCVGLHATALLPWTDRHPIVVGPPPPVSDEEIFLAFLLVTCTGAVAIAFQRTWSRHMRLVVIPLYFVAMGAFSVLASLFLI
jgi:hypothetical protein